jgi:GT2 family glycosyltransferase
VWDELGGFDPIYFMYGEDTDLSLRAGRLGYRPIFSPEPTIMHVGSASSTLEFDKGMLLMRGKATLIRRHWRGISQAWALTMLAVGVGLRGILAGLGAGNARRQVWSQLWRHRREWMGGYPAAARATDEASGIG